VGSSSTQARRETSRQCRSPRSRQGSREALSRLVPALWPMRRSGPLSYARGDSMATCAECGADFVSRQEGEGKRGGEPQKYCSKQCGWRAARRQRSATYTERERERLARRVPARNLARYGTKRQQAARRKLKRAACGSYAGRWVAGPCVCCGEVTVVRARQAIGKPLYCSHACRTRAKNVRNIELRREAKHRRRARQRNAFVAPVVRRDIYERDTWTCQLCGTPVERDAVVPHWYAPTLDHIIPLAAGGTHEPSNAQCAHFICNARKGARVAA
jgi:5-methylcytosine-specific restriction endonuclease McrA